MTFIETVFTGGEKLASSPGIGPIFLQELLCSRNEKTLLDCKK